MIFFSVIGSFTRNVHYEEIANLSEDKDGKEDVAKAMEDGTVLP